MKAYHYHRVNCSEKRMKGAFYIIESLLSPPFFNASKNNNSSFWIKLQPKGFYKTESNNYGKPFNDRWALKGNRFTKALMIPTSPPPQKKRRKFANTKKKPSERGEKKLRNSEITNKRYYCIGKENRYWKRNDVT